MTARGQGPERPPTGWRTTRRLFYVTLAVVVVASVALVLALTLGRV